MGMIMEQDITLNLKILIYGAGVIGSLYAVLFSKNKNTDVSVYARGKRLEGCGKGRIIPAFPGAGGSIDDGILNAGLTPAWIQPTTFGEISERNTKRTSELSRLFHNSHIPYQIVSDMHLWQLCHLAMVVPIADAYYESEDPENAGADRRLMSKTAGNIKRNMKWLKNHEGKLSPKKFYMFTLVPKNLIAVGLTITFKSEFGDRFMYRHSMKAPDEMRELHRKFYGYIKDRSKKS